MIKKKDAIEIVHMVRDQADGSEALGVCDAIERGLRALKDLNAGKEADRLFAELREIDRLLDQSGGAQTPWETLFAVAGKVKAALEPEPVLDPQEVARISKARALFELQPGDQVTLRVRRYENGELRAEDVQKVEPLCPRPFSYAPGSSPTEESALQKANAFLIDWQRNAETLESAIEQLGMIARGERSTADGLRQEVSAWKSDRKQALDTLQRFAPFKSKSDDLQVVLQRTLDTLRDVDGLRRTIAAIEAAAFNVPLDKTGCKAPEQVITQVRDLYLANQESRERFVDSLNASPEPGITIERGRAKVEPPALPLHVLASERAKLQHVNPGAGNIAQAAIDILGERLLEVERFLQRAEVEPSINQAKQRITSIEAGLGGLAERLEGWIASAADAGRKIVDVDQKIERVTAEVGATVEQLGERAGEHEERFEKLADQWEEAADKFRTVARRLKRNGQAEAGFALFGAAQSIADAADCCKPPLEEETEEENEEDE